MVLMENELKKISGKHFVSVKLNYFNLFSHFVETILIITPIRSK